MLGPTERHLVLDGKALRGIHGDEVPGVRLVALYAPQAGLVLAQAGVRTLEELATTELERARAKQEAELSVAPRLLQRVPLAGRVVSGDALYCQRALCRQIREAGGHYLFAIKDNQPTLLEDVALPPTSSNSSACSRQRRRIPPCRARPGSPLAMRSIQGAWLQPSA